MSKKKLLVVILLVIVKCNMLPAQIIPDNIKDELYKLNKVFDSSSYVGFDLHILYYTDTVNGNSKRDEKTVEYYLNKKNYYYKVDEIEFMQNDSFSINVDHDTKAIVATKNNSSNPSDQFVLKNFIDQSLTAYDSAYDVLLDNPDSSTKRIIFSLTSAYADSAFTFSKFTITYDIESYKTLKIQVRFKDMVPFDGDTSLSVTPSLLTQNLEMNFLHYRGLPTTRFFDETNYLYFDKILKQYLPGEKFKYYKIITAGLEHEEMENNQQQLKDNTQ